MSKPGDKDVKAKIKEICHKLIFSPFLDDSQTRAHVKELSLLACQFDYMEIDRSSMLRHFAKYESLKQKAKKDEAFSKVRDSLYRLRRAADFPLVARPPAADAAPRR